MKKNKPNKPNLTKQQEVQLDKLVRRGCEEDSKLIRTFDEIEELITRVVGEKPDGYGWGAGEHFGDGSNAAEVGRKIRELIVFLQEPVVRLRTTLVIERDVRIRYATDWRRMEPAKQLADSAEAVEKGYRGSKLVSATTTVVPEAYPLVPLQVQSPREDTLREHGTRRLQRGLLVQPKPAS